MKSFPLVAAAALAAAFATSALAGPPHGGGPGGMWGPKHTPGWSMMSKEERNTHRAQMQGAKTHAECMAAMEKHHEAMMARAKERGVNMPAMPQGRACDGMPDAPAKK